ncbi:MAG: mandelate racemase [Burkholderiales bacterium]|nr:mandelate racemase [Burkholderiales bacterium]
MSLAPLFAVDAVDLFERPVKLRMPFRFGVVTLTAAPQAFVRVRIRLEDGRQAEGMAAELMAPKWFDKNPALSNDDNFEQLRNALRIARELYTDGGVDSAFGHFARHYRAQIGRGAHQGLNSLVANYGPALIDRAVLDALCRALHRPFHEVIRSNLAGIQVTPLTPDLAGFELDSFLAGLRPAEKIDARHTVGLVDPITANDPHDAVGDGLPETLEEVVSTYGHRWFKLKVAGNVDADVARLLRIASVLDRIDGTYHSTLDGNEQYDSIEGVQQLWQRMRAEAGLQRLCDSVIFIEQPIKRTAALAQDVSALSAQKPVILDESDDTLDAFVQGKERGYLGVSSKTCKGLYKSILNRARCARWNALAGDERFIMSAEDLTIQAGLALQQDLALVSLLGITHVERNGHHYVNGMAALGAGEQQAFLDAHPDLYERSHGAVRLRLQGGELHIGSLHRGAGFASCAAPDWNSLQPIADP